MGGTIVIWLKSVRTWKRFPLYLLFALFFHYQLSCAQTYPVYITPTLLPPYSLKLSDYSRMGSQRLMITIRVNDIKISNLPVKLHIKMESAGVTIETMPTLTTLPIYLNGGGVQVLYGDDLANYFNINNLTFKGYSKEAYRSSGQLPDGFWRFTVEALHYGTNRVVSNSGTVTAWMAVGKPPQLRSPEEGAEMGQIMSMPLVFSWLQSNTGIPMAGVQHLFEMWEMRVPGVDPYVVAASMPVFHSEPVYGGAVMLTLTPASMLMEPGMRYAWRVTAFDPAGLLSFDQDGHSQVRTFTYQSKCDTVRNFTAGNRLNRMTFQWDPAPNHTSFNTEMHNPDNEWQTASTTYLNKIEYNNLDYGKRYRMRVQAVCNGDMQNTSEWTAWRMASIPMPVTRAKDECPECGCSDEPVTEEVTNFTVSHDLKAGDTIRYVKGATRFIIESATPQDENLYKGVFLLWWQQVGLKIICEYWNLSINTDKEVLRMNFKSIYDPTFSLDVAKIQENIDKLADNIAVLYTSTYIRDTVKVNRPLDGLYYNKEGVLVQAQADPAGGPPIETAYTGDRIQQNTLVQGANGEEFVVTGSKQVMGKEEFAATGGNSRLMDDYNQEKEAKAQPSVAFTKSPKQVYGFDAYAPVKSNIQTNYPELKSGYRPAFKSVKSFDTDKVQAEASADVTFRDEMGIPPIKTGEDLTLRGSAGGAEMALYAYRKNSDTTETVVGKLNLLSLDENHQKVYLVPVNKAALPNVTDLQHTLNNVYAQAVTDWVVEDLSPSPSPQGRGESGISVTFPSGNMTHGGSNAVSVFNADQKAVIKAFETTGTMEKDALYLFFVADVKGKDGIIGGYMPLQRQAGFIYDVPNNELIAHELAHGAFNLRHTFSTEENTFIAAQNTTENLMDYKGGTELWMHQWKKIQSPDRVWLSFLEGEEEGEGAETAAATIRDDEFVEKILRLIRISNRNAMIDPNNRKKYIHLNLRELWKRNESVITGMVDIKGQKVEVRLYDAKGYEQIGALYDYTGKNQSVITFATDGTRKNDVFQIVIAKQEFMPQVLYYLFGSQTQHEFISTDKRWVLDIYSPKLSHDFLTAGQGSDLLEQRRIAYWALTNKMEDGYLDRKFEEQFKIPDYTGGYGASLRQNPQGAEGVTVYLHNVVDGLIERATESLKYESILRRSAKDANYPVDINLYDGADVPALGKVYYKDYDFRGYFVEASGAILTFVEGTGFIYGYLKGFGYTEYTYRNLPGLAFEFPDISGGMMTGKYVGQGIPL